MNLKDKIKICSICKNRMLDRNIGLVCSLTEAKPEFNDSCDDYITDQSAIHRGKEKHSYNDSNGISVWSVVWGVILVVFFIIRLMSRIAD